MCIFRQQEQTKRTVAQFQLCQRHQKRPRKFIDVSTRLESGDLSCQRIRQPEYFAIQRTEKTSLYLHGIDRACFARKRRAHSLCDLPMDLVSISSVKIYLLLSIFFLKNFYSSFLQRFVEIIIHRRRTAILYSLVFFFHNHNLPKKLDI